VLNLRFAWYLVVLWYWHSVFSEAVSQYLINHAKLQMAFSVFYKGADLDVLYHPILNAIYYMVRSTKMTMAITGFLQNLVDYLQHRIVALGPQHCFLQTVCNIEVHYGLL